MKTEINSCRVEIVENAILFVTSWDYDVGKISWNNYLSDVTMAFDVFHALHSTQTVDFHPKRLIYYETKV